jgi:hypothetical protein
LHGLRFSGGQFQHHLQIIDLFPKPAEGIEFAPDIIGFVDHFLGRFLVIPETLARHL